MLYDSRLQCYYCGWKKSCITLDDEPYRYWDKLPINWCRFSSIPVCPIYYDFHGFISNTDVGREVLSRQFGDDLQILGRPFPWGSIVEQLAQLRGGFWSDEKAIEMMIEDYLMGFFLIYPRTWWLYVFFSLAEMVIQWDFTNRNGDLTASYLSTWDHT